MKVRIFFLIELIVCFASVYYSNFIFFYMKSRFGFGELENLLLAAFNGFVYVFASWQGGRFVQRFGAIRSIYLGCFMFIAVMAAGFFLHWAFAQIIIFSLWTISVCFIWPAIEASVCENAGTKLPDRVGYYNITWAASSAIAYFTAGMLLEHLGMRSLFWIPFLLVVVSIIVFSFAIKASAAKVSSSDKQPPPPPTEKKPPGNARNFMHLAWLANPLSYVAINTLIPLIPSLSSRLGLTTSLAGIFCSIWLFARLGAFFILWRWTGWHYQFKWLAGAFAILIACFAGIILTSSLPILLAAQIGFGLSIGLVYYSSLYYSMNASEEKGAHGGLHEAMIGAGLFLGPACGGGGLALLPAIKNIGVWSVSGLLVVGFSFFLWIGRFSWKRTS
jgi:predicted MFS family arabinose efflux permease